MVRRMAQFTIELYKIVESGFDIGLKDYPIFDEEHRQVLNSKILNRYWDYEIGAETPDRFRRYFITLMNEIMPYYNQLYMSEAIKFNPLFTDYFQQKEKNQRNRVQETGGQTQSSGTAGTKDRTELYRDTTGSESGKTTGTEESNGGYSKKGSGEETGKETGTRSQDTKGTSGNTRTIDITKENTGGYERTDENTTKTVTSQTDSGNTDTTNNQTTDSNNSLSRTENFSDVPQAGWESTTTVNPDGSVTTESTGYLTTQTQISENAKGHSTVQSTGNEKYDRNTNGTSDVTANGEQHDTHNETNTENGTVTDSGTSSQNLTENTDSDVTGENTWEESGTNNNGRSTSQDSTNTSTNTTKENTGRNTESVNNNISIRAESGKTETSDNGFTEFWGRRGVSPSSMLTEYRQTLLNIDMEIVNQLHTLFMEVWE